MVESQVAKDVFISLDMSAERQACHSEWKRPFAEWHGYDFVSIKTKNIPMFIYA